MDNQDDNIVHGSYGGLLFDPKWKAKRERILQRDNYRCICCGATENLRVHHKQYHIDSQGRKHVPWDYDDKYLVTLCDRCHRIGHSLYKIPIFEY